ncbi:MAG: MraZ protein [Candidatus Krumholzibacteriia bacterium]|jgi:MraZ protein
MNGNQPQSPLPESAFAFNGSYVRSVDVKGRFNLPFKFLRGGSGPEEEKFVVARGADDSLSLMPHSVWMANFNRLRQEGAPGPKLRNYLRKMSSQSQTVEPDGQGRVAVSSEMLKAIGIDKKIEIVGMGEHMELWDPDALVKANAVTDDESEYDNQFFR